MYWLRLMEELTKTMQLVFSPGDEQSGNDFRCLEGFHRAGIQPDTQTHTSLYSMLKCRLIYAHEQTEETLAHM